MSLGDWEGPGVWHDLMKMPQARYPDPNVVRFVRREFRRPYRMLDIGSGGGAHSRFFEDEGWEVTAVDIAHSTRANYHGDICWWRMTHEWDERFEFILDYNTLCHVEGAPYKNIHDWLAPSGVFLTFHPTLETWRGVADGKGYCCFASEHMMREKLAPFHDVKIEHESRPDFRGHQIETWICWGTK